MYYFTVLAIPGHQKRADRLERTFLTPKCPALLWNSVRSLLRKVSGTTKTIRSSDSFLQSTPYCIMNWPRPDKAAALSPFKVESSS